MSADALRMTLRQAEERVLESLTSAFTTNADDRVALANVLRPTVHELLVVTTAVAAELACDKVTQYARLQRLPL